MIPDATYAEMTYACDLHLHSSHSRGVSPQMTLPNLTRWAQLKGLDVLSTGDCLHFTHLTALKQNLHHGDDGFLHPSPDLLRASRRDLPPRLHREVRFVLGTEVSCNLQSPESWRGIHLLIYLPNFTAVDRLREILSVYGDLNAELQGRPILQLPPHELLQHVLDIGGVSRSGSYLELLRFIAQRH